jgi:tRNA(Ile)-lysidine synthase
MRPGERVGVAVSGGGDSVALLRLLLEARAELGIVLSVVHFNHKIRGAEADADEAFAAALAAAHGLEFHGSSAGTPTYARKQGMSLEAAGRELRYRYFRKLLEEGAADRIATGHTRDDQAETVLLRFLRGAGTRGLAGIFPQLPVASCQLPASHQPSVISGQERQPAIVRPLLETGREELRAYLDRIGQVWREDASNLDAKHARNRVRHELLPRLREFNPALEEALAESAEIARGEEEFWEELVKSSVVSRQASGKAQGQVAFEVEKLLRQPLALQRRLVRAAAEGLGCRLEFRHGEQVLNLLRRRPATAAHTAVGEGKRLQLPAGLRAEVRGRELRLIAGCQNKREARSAGAYEYALEIPGEVLIKSLGRRIRASVVAGGAGESRYNRAQLMDPGLLAPRLRVRNWRPGDRYWPAHTKSPAKVKELLQERRIAQPAKSLWPVVVSGAEIVWVPGFPIPARFCLRGGAAAAAVLLEEEVVVGK